MEGRNSECHPAYSFLFIIILGGYMLLFPQSTTRIILRLTSVSKYVMWYSCKSFVHCILIYRELLALHVHALKNNYKIGLWGTLGTMGEPNHCRGHQKLPTTSRVLSSMRYICFRKIL